MHIKTVLDQNQLVFTLDNLFNKEKCEYFLSKVNISDFEEAPVTVAKDTFEMLPNIRNNTRIILDDDAFSRNLFSVLKNYLPERHRGFVLKGLNGRFRYYRYEKGQEFKPHYDGRYNVSRDYKSLLTVLIYLSDDLIGGETAFFTDDLQLRFKVKPCLGQVLVFDHHQMHSGEPVLEGFKYVLRTDVMYERLLYKG